MREVYKNCIIEADGRDLLNGLLWCDAYTISFKAFDGRTEVRSYGSGTTFSTKEKAIAAGITSAKHTIDSGALPVQKALIARLDR